MKQVFFVWSAYYIIHFFILLSLFIYLFILVGGVKKSFLSPFICVVTPWISKNSYHLDTYDDI